MPFELVQVTAAYSNAVLVAILPHVSDFANKLQLPIPIPVTVAQVRQFGCSPRADHVGGLVTLTNDYSFTFDQGAVVLYRSPFSYYSAQEPERVSQFYGAAKIKKGEAIKVAHECLNKLGYSDSALHLDETPKVTSPSITKAKEIPRFLIEWLGPNEAKSPGGIPRERVAVEVDSSTGKILMLGIQTRTARRPNPKLSVPTPATDAAAPKTQPAGEGRTVSAVSSDYARAFLVAILPQLSDFVTNANVDVKVPIQVNDVDLSHYDCGLVGGLPRACVYLKSGDRFWYEHGQVTEFNARDSYRLPEPGKLPEDKPADLFFGPVNASPDEALSEATKALNKLGYTAKIPQLRKRPEIVPPTKHGTNYFARYFFNWWPAREGFQIAVAEVDATSKKLKSLYINDRNNPNIWRESPKILVEPKANSDRK